MRKKKLALIMTLFITGTEIMGTGLPVMASDISDNVIATEDDAIVAEDDAIIAENDRIVSEEDVLTSEANVIEETEDALTSEVNVIAAEDNDDSTETITDFTEEIAAEVSPTTEELSGDDAETSPTAEPADEDFLPEDAVLMTAEENDNLSQELFNGGTFYKGQKKNLRTSVEVEDDSVLDDDLYYDGTLVDVKVENQAAYGSVNAVLLQKSEEGDAWTLSMNEAGRATVTLVIEYQDGDVTKTFESTSTVVVINQSYDVSLTASKTDTRVLPGETIDLTAKVSKEYYDTDKGELVTGTPSDGEIKLVWEQEYCSDPDGFSCQQDEKNPNILHVTAKAGTEVAEIQYYVSVTSYNETTKAWEKAADSDSVIVQRYNGYYQLQLNKSWDDIQNLVEGESLVVTPNVKYFDAAHPNGTEATEKINYFWMFDQDKVSITDGSGKNCWFDDEEGEAIYCEGPFTITRLSMDVSEAFLYARVELPDGDLSLECNYFVFGSPNYDFSIAAEDDRRELFIDDTLKLNTVFADVSWKDSFEVRWEVGYDTYQDDTDTVSFHPADKALYTVNQTGKESSITLQGAKVWEWLQTKGYTSPSDIEIHIRASLYNVTEKKEYQLSSTDHSVTLYRPSYETYDFETELERLQGSTYEIPAKTTIYLVNKENPYGNDLEGSVTSVTVENSKEDGDPDAVSAQKTDDGWTLLLKKPGHAKVTVVSAVDGHPDWQATNTIQVYVTQKIYNVTAGFTTGTNVILPGTTADYKADVEVLAYDEEKGVYKDTTEHLSYAWTIEDNETEDTVVIEPDKTDASILHIQVKDGAEESSFKVVLTVSVQDPATGKAKECAKFSDYIMISSCYLAVENINEKAITQLRAGESVTITPVVKWYDKEHKDGQVLTKDYSYTVAFDSEDFEVKTTDGKKVAAGVDKLTGSITLKKLAEAEAHVSIDASFTSTDNNTYWGGKWITCHAHNYNRNFCTRCGVLEKLSAPKLTKLETVSGGIKVTWGKVENALKYRVFRKTASGKWTKAGDTTDTSLVDTGAVDGTTYTYTVRCLTEDGKSYTSPYESTQTITYQGKLSTPKLTSVQNAAKGVTITWNKVNGAASYRVFRKTAKGKWTKVGDTKKTSLTDTKAVSGTAYTYTVRCLRPDGKTYSSSYDTKGLSITYIAQPAITKTSNSAKGVTITWGKVKGAASYRVFYKNSKGKWTKAGDTTSTSYTDTKAKNNTTYTYTVRCITKDGKSYTSSYDTKGKSILRLSAPTLSSASNSSAGSVTVKWKKVSSATGYQICYKTGTTSKTITVKGAANVSKVLTGLAKGKTYNVYVRYYKTVSKVNYYSAWSSAKKVKITK